MLSKKDFVKKIGKSINIYPLVKGNIKENSINLTASRFAWCLGDGYIIEKNNSYVISAEKTPKSIHIEKGCSAFKDGKIFLLPHQTTVVVTKEVIGVDGTIGGTVHSKVGIAMKGIGHVGTMLGPNYHGRFLVPLHNVTDKVITIKEGESFISVIFYMLKTKNMESNPTVSSHVDKFSSFGIKLSEDEEKILNSDDEKSFKSIQMKMKKSNEYQEFKEENKWKIISFFSLRNILKLFFSLVVFVLMIKLVLYFDSTIGNKDHPLLLSFVTFILTTFFAPLIYKFFDTFD